MRKKPTSMGVSVKINTGPIEARDYAERVPEEKWPILTLSRSGFLHTTLPYDCREVLRFIDEAVRFEMWNKGGYESLDDYILNGLEIDQELIDWLKAGVKMMRRLGIPHQCQCPQCQPVEDYWQGLG